jgi:hypothetical protein
MGSRASRPPVSHHYYFIEPVIPGKISSMKQRLRPPRPFKVQVAADGWLHTD